MQIISIHITCIRCPENIPETSLGDWTSSRCPLNAFEHRCYVGVSICKVYIYEL